MRSGARRGVTWLLITAALLVPACSGPREPSSQAGGGHPAAGGPAAVSTEPAPSPTATAATPRGAPGAEVRRRDLKADERRGGHTIARHVGRTDDELRERLARERVSAASTYADLATAERVVFETLERSNASVLAWRRRTGPRPNLALRFRGPPGVPIGRSLQRRTRDPVPCFDAVVVLRWDVRADDYYVLTSYPEGRR